MIVRDWRSSQSLQIGFVCEGKILLARRTFKRAVQQLQFSVQQFLRWEQSTVRSGIGAGAGARAAG
jgi:hypothetical protein